MSLLCKFLVAVSVCCLLLASSVSATIAAETLSKLAFYETFDGPNPFEGKWVKSVQEKYAAQPVEVRAPKNSANGFEEDKGVVLTAGGHHYGFAAKLDQPIVFKTAEQFVVSYELKTEETLNCGGAYIKLLRNLDGKDLSALNNDSPYTIMFGPDRCGGTNKIHFIVQYQNPVTLAWEEKHYNETVPMKTDKTAHSYSLQVNADNTFVLFVDKKAVKNGSLLEHLVPAINPPETVDDPTDVKPADWVDEEFISDPEAAKPEDWNESEPKMIPDPDAVKPEGWLDDGPATISDPAVAKPADWDDEEDGEWEAPAIPNPACEAAGCGEWKPPSIKNPKYKGKWVAPKITNPAYKGVWAPRKIPNTAYFHEPSPFQQLANIEAIAVEVWTVNGGIVFDNFAISTASTGITDVLEFVSQTTEEKLKAEKAQDKKERKDKKKKELTDRVATAAAGGDWKEVALANLEVKFNEVADLVRENPVPFVGSIIAILVALFLLSPKKKKVKKVTVVESSTPATAAAAAASEAEAKAEDESKDESEYQYDQDETIDSTNPLVQQKPSS